MPNLACILQYILVMSTHCVHIVAYPTLMYSPSDPNHAKRKSIYVHVVEKRAAKAGFTLTHPAHKANTAPELQYSSSSVNWDECLID